MKCVFSDKVSELNCNEIEIFNVEDFNNKWSNDRKGLI